MTPDERAAILSLQSQQAQGLGKQKPPYPRLSIGQHLLIVAILTDARSRASNGAVRSDISEVRDVIESWTKDQLTDD